MFEKIDSFIKNLFKTLMGKKKKAEPSLSPQEEAAKRRRLIEQINHPEDSFTKDEVFDEEELKRVSEQNKNKNYQRIGYYIFGAILAGGMIIYGIFGMLFTKKPDIHLLLQLDGFISAAEVELVEQYVGSVVGDANGDGVIKIEIATASMPAERTDENGELFETSVALIEEALVPYKYAMVIGREEFLQAADNYRGLIELKAGEKGYPLSQTSIGLAQDSPLRQYYIGISRQQHETDIFSAQAYAAFQKMTD